MGAAAASPDFRHDRQEDWLVELAGITEQAAGLPLAARTAILVVLDALAGEDHRSPAAALRARAALNMPRVGGRRES